MNLYLTVFDYLRSATGLETASMLGNVSRLSGAHTAGLTTLTIAPALTVALAVYDPITIFDGASSEVALVASTASIGATSVIIQSPGLVYAHSSGAAWCSNGTSGSLADEIIAGSAWLENITQQPLYLATYTNETLRVPSMRAAFDEVGMLVFRPRRSPVITDTGISVKSNNSDAITYDASQIILDGARQAVSVPWLTTSGVGSTYSLYPHMGRQANLWLSITYTAGYASIPGDVQDACILLVSDILSRRRNATGASEQQMGKQTLIYGTRWNTSGNSLLVKRAISILQQYSMEAY